MSDDSTFQQQEQNPMQGAVPSRPEPGTDDPITTPEDPGRYDPLTSPDDQRPDDWEDPDRDMPEADEPTPLSDDRR
jgi:hypothetical protein